MNLQEKITTHFSWPELLDSEIAKRHRLSNVPGEKEKQAIIRLVTLLMQPLRELYGKPIRITSGYRSPELNRLAGGVPESQHTKGEAVDCVVEDTETLFQVLAESRLDFDQAILYHQRKFLHLSYRLASFNRRQMLFR